MLYLITMINRSHREHSNLEKLAISISLAITFALLAAIAAAAPGDSMDRSKFFENIRINLKNLEISKNYRHEDFFKGERRFVSIGVLLPGQPEISVDNVFNKINSAINSGFVQYDLASDRWSLQEAGGSALLPPGKALKVAKTKKGLVLVDGHHHYFMSILAGSKLVPVEIVADYSHLDNQAAWFQMEKDRLVFNRTMDGGKISKFPKAQEMKNNPNRYLASLLALKVEANMESGTLEVTSIRSRKNAIWIKVNNGIPFVEFYIARLLTEAGIVYNPEWGKIIPESIIEQSRTIISNALKSGKFPELESVAIFESSDKAFEIMESNQQTGKFLRSFMKKNRSFCPMMAKTLFPEIRPD